MHRGIVVNDQYCRSARRYFGNTLCLDHLWGLMFLLLGRNNDCRQPDSERGAFADLALDRDLSAHHLAEVPRDGQPKPAAAVLARRGSVSLREGLEQLAPLLRRQANAAVADPKDEMSRAVGPLPRDPQRDGSLVGKFAGVAEQVEQRLADLGRVGAHGAEVFVAFDGERV